MRFLPLTSPVYASEAHQKWIAGDLTKWKDANQLTRMELQSCISSRQALLDAIRLGNDLVIRLLLSDFNLCGVIVNDLCKSFEICVERIMVANTAVTSTGTALAGDVSRNRKIAAQPSIPSSHPHGSNASVVGLAVHDQKDIQRDVPQTASIFSRITRFRSQSPTPTASEPSLISRFSPVRHLDKLSANPVNCDHSASVKGSVTDDPKSIHKSMSTRRFSFLPKPHEFPAVNSHVNSAKVEADTSMETAVSATNTFEESFWAVGYNIQYIKSLLSLCTAADYNKSLTAVSDHLLEMYSTQFLDRCLRHFLVESTNELLVAASYEALQMILRTIDDSVDKTVTGHRFMETNYEHVAMLPSPEKSIVGGAIVRAGSLSRTVSLAALKFLSSVFSSSYSYSQSYASSAVCSNDIFEPRMSPKKDTAQSKPSRSPPVSTPPRPPRAFIPQFTIDDEEDDDDEEQYAGAAEGLQLKPLGSVATIPGSSGADSSVTVKPTQQQEAKAIASHVVMLRKVVMNFSTSSRTIEFSDRVFGEGCQLSQREDFSASAAPLTTRALAKIFAISTEYGECWNRDWSVENKSVICVQLDLLEQKLVKQLPSFGHDEQLAIALLASDAMLSLVCRIVELQSLELLRVQCPEEVQKETSRQGELVKRALKLLYNIDMLWKEMKTQQLTRIPNYPEKLSAMKYLMKFDMKTVVSKKEYDLCGAAEQIMSKESFAARKVLRSAAIIEELLWELKTYAHILHRVCEHTIDRSDKRLLHGYPSMMGYTLEVLQSATTLPRDLPYLMGADRGTSKECTDTQPESPFKTPIGSRANNADEWSDDETDEEANDDKEFLAEARSPPCTLLEVADAVESIETDFLAEYRQLEQCLDEISIST